MSRKSEARLTVLVYNPTGEPLPSIRVELKKGADSVGPQRTDREGETVFTGLERGQLWDIFVNGEDLDEQVEIERLQEEHEVEYDGEYDPDARHGDEDEEEDETDEDGLDSDEDADDPDDSPDSERVLEDE